MRIWRAAALAVVALLGVAAAAGAASINVSPSSVPAGGTVTLSGSAAEGCSSGDTVTLISPVFGDQHEFAGVPAVLTTADNNVHYSVSTQIPSSRVPGNYTITARCGGGNLGVQASLQVTAASGALPRTGLAGWALAALGLCLVAAGAALRSRIKPS